MGLSNKSYQNVLVLHAVVFGLYASVLAGLCTRLDDRYMWFPTVLVVYKSHKNNTVPRLSLYPTPSVPVPVIMVIVLYLEMITSLLLLLMGDCYYMAHTVKSRNPIRWVSYAVTAPLQRLCVALYCGMKNIHVYTTFELCIIYNQSEFLNSVFFL